MDPLCTRERQNQEPGLEYLLPQVEGVAAVQHAAFLATPIGRWMERPGPGEVRASLDCHLPGGTHTPASIRNNNGYTEREIIYSEGTGQMHRVSLSEIRGTDPTALCGAH